MIVFIKQSDTLTKEEIELYNNLLIKWDIDEITPEEHVTLKELADKHFNNLL